MTSETVKHPNPRLVEIQIEGFKSIRKQTIPLQPLTVLIGANGAGKSNLVQFISLVAHLQTGSLQRWVRLRGGANELLHFGSKNTDAIKARLDFETGSGRNFYSFELSPNTNDEFVIWNEKVGYQQDGSEGYFVVDLPSDAGRESFYSVHKHGEPFQGFSQVQLRTADVIGAFLKEFQSFQFHDTTPEARIRQSSEPHLNRFLGNNGANLAAWLLRLQVTHPNSFAMIEATVRRAFPDFGRFELTEDPLNGKIQFLWQHRRSEGTFRASQFSDGTLRFIALCALFLQPIELMPDVILVDEPELGLHPTALQILSGMAQSVVAQGKQVILTTQSPAFLSTFAPENVVVVERDGECSVFRSMMDKTEELQEWLVNFESLGALWEMNLLGGKP